MSAVVWMLLAAAVLAALAIAVVVSALHPRHPEPPATRSPDDTPPSDASPAAQPPTRCRSRPTGRRPWAPGNTAVTIDREGLSVRTRGQGLSTAWHLSCQLRWHEVTSLHLDSGVHDPAVSLYATTRTPGPRRHLLDAHALARSEWSDLAYAVSAATDRRIRLDLRGLDEGRPRDA